MLTQRGLATAGRCASHRDVPPLAAEPFAREHCSAPAGATGARAGPQSGVRCALPAVAGAGLPRGQSCRGGCGVAPHEQLCPERFYKGCSLMSETKADCTRVPSQGPAAHRAPGSEPCPRSGASAVAVLKGLLEVSVFGQSRREAAVRDDKCKLLTAPFRSCFSVFVTTPL